MLLLVGGYSFVHPRWVSAALTFIRSVQEFRILEGSKRKVFSIQGSFDLRKWCFFLRPASLFFLRPAQQGRDLSHIPPQNSPLIHFQLNPRALVPGLAHHLLLGNTRERVGCHAGVRKVEE